MDEKPDNFSGLALAGEWGITLAVLTMFGALGGYWLGQKLNNNALTVILVLVGIVAGFSFGVVRMQRVSEERTRKQNKE